MNKTLIALAAIMIFGAGDVLAKSTGSRSSGGGHTSRSSSPGPGTGAKAKSTTVKGYVKKDGKYVAPAKRSTPDSTTRNNWSTKGNVNPSTGKAGTRIESSRKHN